MSDIIKSELSLSMASMHDIDQRLASLSAAGVTASTEHSGEMNFSGCASGSCMAWA